MYLLGSLSRLRHDAFVSPGLDVIQGSVEVPFGILQALLWATLGVAGRQVGVYQLNQTIKVLCSDLTSCISIATTAGVA